MLVPLPGFLAVICFWVWRLSRYGVQAAPVFPAGCVILPLLPLGLLLKRDKMFLHNNASLLVCPQMFDDSTKTVGKQVIGCYIIISNVNVQTSL